MTRMKMNTDVHLAAMEAAIQTRRSANAGYGPSLDAMTSDLAHDARRYARGGDHDRARRLAALVVRRCGKIAAGYIWP